MKKSTFVSLPIMFLIGVFILFSCGTYAQRVGRWEKLGEQTVNLTLEKDVIRCANQGTFRAIKFRVERAPVSFLRVYVKYANGGTENLKFNQLVRPGGDSGILDLRGNKRVIKEIVVYYKSEKKARHGGGNNLHKQARVQTWGRH